MQNSLQQCAGLEPELACWLPSKLWPIKPDSLRHLDFLLPVCWAECLHGIENAMEVLWVAHHPSRPSSSSDPWASFSWVCFLSVCSSVSALLDVLDAMLSLPIDCSKTTPYSSRLKAVSFSWDFCTPSSGAHTSGRSHASRICHTERSAVCWPCWFSSMHCISNPLVNEPSLPQCGSGNCCLWNDEHSGSQTLFEGLPNEVSWPLCDVGTKAHVLWPSVVELFSDVKA